MAGLTGLQRLGLLDTYVLPGSLSLLTQLQMLDLCGIHCPGGEVLDKLAAMLRQLTGLTSLGIQHTESLRGRLPGAELAALPRLRHCVLTCIGDTQLPPDQLGQAALPSGPWQHSLRQLHAGWALLERSRAFLEGAGRLEHLRVVMDTPGASERAALQSPIFQREAVGDAFFHWFWVTWLPRHRALRLLTYRLPAVNTRGPPAPGWLQEAAADLGRRSPRLDVELSWDEGLPDMPTDWLREFEAMATMRGC